jgi:hypothetical protein
MIEPYMEEVRRKQVRWSRGREKRRKQKRSMDKAGSLCQGGRGPGEQRLAVEGQ